MKTLFLFCLATLCASAADRAALDRIDSLDASFRMMQCLKLTQEASGGSSVDFEILWRLVRAEVNVAEEAMDANDKATAEDQINQALTTSEQLVELYPGRSMAHYYRALALGRRALLAGGREKVELSQGIETHALKAIELNPENGRAHGLLGRYYREMAHLPWLLRKVAETLYGNLPEGGDELALNHLQRSSALMPDWVFARYELAETYQVMGLKDQAAAQFRSVLEMPETDHRDHLLKDEARKALKNL
ncbi:MAG: hypothetical protein KDC10_11570 [Calditrichaeota bacterium]|nr:hypothetical protein [Candidatus Cloacimonadota bacterium]MCA9786298.1 hypothetical protein [Candidatus Cloacimonadota bacterium]MCB1047825.1 hypothetical protein [Calditrichota bacterium]MCB9472429.1 hypothetical protein [Candidatus Delongbacteria bacterium]